MYLKQELAKQFINIMAPGSNINQLELQEKEQGLYEFEGPYSEKMIVSFGNYLLKRYNVMVMSDDGSNVPLYQREVHHADVCNWKEQEGWDYFHLPSAHQVGDIVSVSFGDTGSIKEGEVIKIHFSESKVLYDISIPIICEDTDNNVHTAYTRIYNVDSAFVSKK